MRTTNPTLREDTFAGSRSYGADAMTVRGTVEKTTALLFLVICGAAYSWSAMKSGAGAGPWVMVSALGGFIIGMVTVFKAAWAPVTAPIYAVLEGLFLGGISAVFDARYPGIVFNAVLLTFGTLGMLLAGYRFGIVRATDGFRRGIFAATGAVALIYFVGWILSLFGKGVPYIHGSGWIGIGFSLVVVCIAALNFVLDFDLIERGAEQGAPRHMEWYGAFGLLVTLVWLYLEILRLLSKLRER